MGYPFGLCGGMASGILGVEDVMKKLNPAEFEIDLFCKGMRLEEECLEGRPKLAKVRAGLGSGLELKFSTPHKTIHVNVPVQEAFALESPYLMKKRDGNFFVSDERSEGKLLYPVEIVVPPAWYERKTTRGVPMEQVGALQGTYLGIYVGRVCGFWSAKNPQPMNCRFCATGLNVGVSEAEEKSVDDVVETALAAKEENGVTFVHFNSGDQVGGGLDVVEPYVRAIKKRVGALVGVQVLPSKDLSKYDRLIDAGVDHFSFCYEFQNPKYFNDYCPGKAAALGQQPFFDAMAYTAEKMGKGRNSGEIIAGIEPVEDTLEAVDFITSLGCFPTVCIFRPVRGTAMQDFPSPPYEEMVRVMRRVFKSCMEKGIPIGLAPNIEVSLVVNPTDARYLVPPSLKKKLYLAKLKLIKSLAGTMFKKRMQPLEQGR